MKCEESNLPNKIKTSGTIPDIIVRLGGGTKKDSYRTFPIVHISERRWISKAIKEGVAAIRTFKENEIDCWILILTFHFSLCGALE